MHGHTTGRLSGSTTRRAVTDLKVSDATHMGCSSRAPCVRPVGPAVRASLGPAGGDARSYPRPSGTGCPDGSAARSGVGTQEGSLRRGGGPWTVPRPVDSVQRPGTEATREEAMHVTLRRYAEVGARMYEMVFRKVEAGLVPKLKGQPGFRLYCAS